MSSAPAALLLIFYFFCLYYFYNNFTHPEDVYNSLVDLVTFVVIGCGGIIAGLVWLIRWLSHLRASQRQTQPPQKLEQPLVQKVHTH